MAAAVTSAWSKKPGAWALDSEANESELQTLAPASSGELTAEFPSLTAAISAKPKKKSKPQTMSLSEFSVSKTSKTFSLTRDEAVSLPTGPRQRTAEELADGSRLGGGFRSYGLGGEREPRKREVREPMGPSRADEVDDWGSTKRNVSREGVERRERGFFGNGSESKADESDNWGLNKVVSSVPVGEQNGPSSLVINNNNNKAKGSNPFGEARPREEVLKEKGKDWKEIDEKLESMKVKDAEVAAFGKRGFGKGSFSEFEAERSWRKADSGDVRPQSADKVENGVAEEAQDLQE